MIPQRFEIEATYSNYEKSERQPQNRGRSEPKKKLKKVRSIRLLRLSSMRSSPRAPKSQYDNLSLLSTLDSQTSEQTTPIEMSDGSPNYMKATSSSHAKESFQSSQRVFARKSFTRMSTLKLKRTLTRKRSGGTEPKRNLKSSRSIKLATVKGLRSRHVKGQYKARSVHSESINCTDGQNSKSPSDNSQRVITRRLSLKPVRILSKMSTFKSNKSSLEKSPRISQSPDSSLHKATCSSALKDSHFPDQIDLPLDGSGSQGVLARKVCPYTYCSLHGRHHDNLPPLKRFLSMRRRLLKTQKSMKMESRPVTRSKHSGNTKKGTQTSWKVHNEDPASKTAHSGRSHFRNVKNLPRDSPVRIRNTPVSTYTGGGTSAKEDEENLNFRYNAEVLLGETSLPHISFEEYLSDSLVVKGYNLSSILAIKETNMECCSFATEMDKPDSKVIVTARNDNKVAASKKIDESINSVLIDDQPEIINSELPLPKHPGLCGKHSLLKDDGAVPDSEVLGAEASLEKQEERNSILKLTNPKSSGENLNAYEFTSASDQLSYKSKGSNQYDVVELTSTTAVTFSASDNETLEEERTTKDKNMEPGYEMLQVTSPQRESKPACTTGVAYRMKEGDKKYVKMWHLIYKHAVLSNAGKDEDKLPLDGEDKEGQGKDDLSFDGVSSSSCQDYCGKDQDIDGENEHVVELVQKAFDEILLPETEDLSSDDHSKSRGMASDEELLEKSQGKEGDVNTSTSRESPKEAWLKVDNFRNNEEERTAQRMGAKPDLKTPKSWSNLKKVILLKRFVKALEKVRNFNLRTHRHIPPDANLEAEKVYLRHQTAEEKKNVEEWMLDYALQKVISKLGPAQKRRVSLLVEAFETILPFQGTENGPQPSATVETQANIVRSLSDSSDHSEEVTGKVRDYDYSTKLVLGKAPCTQNSIEECADNVSDNPMVEQQYSIVIKERRFNDSWTETVKNIPASNAVDGDWNGKQRLASSYDKGENNSIVDDYVCLAETKDSGSLSFSTPDDLISTCHEESPTNEIVDEAPRDLIFDSTTEIPNSKSESCGRDFETKNLTCAIEEPLSMSKSLILKSFVRSLGSNLVSSAAPSDLLGKPEADRKEKIVKTNPKTGNLDRFPTPEESEAPYSAVVEPETQQEKQNHTGLWYFVYKHMASGIAANDFKPLVGGEDEKESGYDGSRITGTNTSISYETISVVNQDIPLKHHGVADPEVELHQMEAIKIVEEAIDAIHPDVQDHSTDGQLLTDNMISDNSKQSHRTEEVYNEELNQKEQSMKSGNGITQEQDKEEPELKEGNKPSKQLPRSWSNLKKVIMLRRFIKALEKVRKFNPQERRYLPVEPDPEAEKVHLRHQDMGERKGTEEWMLDHALRQVVAKLTPARKRKVELLVEAFETVIPTIKN